MCINPNKRVCTFLICIYKTKQLVLFKNINKNDNTILNIKNNLGFFKKNGTVYNFGET